MLTLHEDNITIVSILSMCLAYATIWSIYVPKPTSVILYYYVFCFQQVQLIVWMHMQKYEYFEVMLVIVVAGSTHTPIFKLYCGTGATSWSTSSVHFLYASCRIRAAWIKMLHSKSPPKTSVALQLVLWYKSTNPKLLRCNTHQVVLAWSVYMQANATHYIQLFHSIHSIMRLKGLVFQRSNILNCIIFSMITFTRHIMFFGICIANKTNVHSHSQGNVIVAYGISNLTAYRVLCLSSRSQSLGVSVVHFII